MNFVWGIVAVLIGIAVIKYSFQIVSLFGHIPWAEQHLGGGGTYTMYKIAGVFIVILGMFYIFGGLGFIVNPLAPLFGG